MHSRIATLLFILVPLSSALLAPSQDLSMLQPPSPPMHHPSTCFARYTNYWDATENYVFFNSPNETHFNFTITTKYLKFYPKTLAQWLEASGFHIVNASTIPDSELCGWLSGASVQSNGRIRGTVGYKYNRAVVGVGGDASLRAMVPRHHIATHMNTRPSDQTLHRITTILRENAPDADIYYFMALLLGTACSMLGFIVVAYGLVLSVELSRRTRAAPADAEDIELDQIKVHDLSGAGMRRMDADGEEDGSKFTIEITAPAAASASVSSASTSAADPPPIYSVDGVGR